MTLLKVMRAFCLVVGIFLGVFNAGCKSKPTVWIYTSLYKEVIAEMEPALLSALGPSMGNEVSIKWYQGGSEVIAAKLSAELSSGRPQADLVLTSDPLWYLELKRLGKWLPYESAAMKLVPAYLRDPDGAYTTARLPVVVMAYNSEVISEAQAPKRWQDLQLPEWKNKISMGSPLESGTHFTAVSVLSKQFGWDFFRDLRKNEIISAGGNSSVISRMETREAPLGIVLLENILKAQAKGSPIRPIYPEEGAILIPSPVAILKDTQEPELAKKIADWFFSAEAQNLVVKGGMYSPLPGVAAPKGALDSAAIIKKVMPWNSEVLESLFLLREQSKAKFAEIVLH